MSKRMYLQVAGTFVVALLVWTLLYLPGLNEPPTARKLNDLPKARSTGELRAAVEELGWNADIAETYDAGPGASYILILADVHEDAVEKVNANRIRILKKVFDIEGVYLENISGELHSDENLKMRQEANRAANFPEGWEKKRKSDPIMGYSPSYTKLFEESELNCYGFEDSKHFMEIGPAQECAIAYEFIAEKLPTLRTNAITLDQRIFDQLFKAQKMLKNYPLFDPTRLKNKSEISVADTQYLNDLISKHEAWLDEHVTLRRNKFAVQNTLARMKSKGQKRAAIVIGMDHVNPIITPTVQEMLKNEGVSFMILYPNDPSTGLKFEFLREQQ